MFFTYTLLLATLGSQSTHFKEKNALQCLYGEVFAFVLLCYVENKTCSFNYQWVTFLEDTSHPESKSYWWILWEM